MFTWLVGEFCFLIVLSACLNCWLFSYFTWFIVLDRCGMFVELCSCVFG